jgi:hypothetical protein
VREQRLACRRVDFFFGRHAFAPGMWRHRATDPKGLRRAEDADALTALQRLGAEARALTQGDRSGKGTR